MGIILTDEMCERLLGEVTTYTLNEEYTKQALDYLKNVLNGITSRCEEQGITVAYKDYRHKDKNSFINKVYDSIIRNKNKNRSYDEVNDIVGARITCLTRSDVYKVRDLIKNCPNIKVLTDEEEDYIKNPKKSGYMSYHMIVEVPVETDTGTKYIKSEIQLRTIFMDIFAREEHKIRYKGHCSEEDAIRLERLSNSLAILDLLIESKFSLDNKTKDTVEEEQLSRYRMVFDNLSGLYGDLHDKFKGNLQDIIYNYENNGDVLHFESRIKPVESIKRKIEEKNLSCSAEDFLYNINDIIGFKLVCTDLETARDLANKLVEGIENTEYLSVERKSDHLDIPKETGYRGYKISVGYHSPLSLGKPVQFEILIRTLFMDAWTLHHDIIYKDEEARKSNEETFRRLSDELYAKEDDLADIKARSTGNPDEKVDIISMLSEYKNRKAKKLLLENEE